MRREQNDAAYLWDMHDACIKVRRYVGDKTEDAFVADDMVRSAVERQIEIIGEAARCVSEEFRRSHPDIPWRPIVAQRHILAHEYGEVDAVLIWRVATVHIPALLSLLVPRLPARPE